MIAAASGRKGVCHTWRDEEHESMHPEWPSPRHTDSHPCWDRMELI